MRKPRQELWFAVAALAAGVAITWRAVSAYRKRQYLLQCGDICELHSVWANVDGCRIHARVCIATQGATPIVFVHGLGVSASYFIPTAERLAADFPVYAPDLPGHGRSDTPLEALSISDLAQALLAWMDAMRIERAILVGQSMGGQIVVEAALQHPSRVDRLILIGLPPDPAARRVAEQCQRFVIGGLYERPSLIRHLVKDYARMGRRLVPEFWFMLEDPIEDKLPRVAVPTMIVRGEKDPLASQQWIDEAARLVGTDRVAVIPGWGHAVQYSAATQLINAIRPFLSQTL